MSKIKKFLASGIFFSLALLATYASAATDTDYDTMISSSTDLLDDYKAALLLSLIALVGIVVALSFGKNFLIMGIRWVKKAIFGGGRRR